MQELSVSAYDMLEIKPQKSLEVGGKAAPFGVTRFSHGPPISNVSLKPIRGDEQFCSGLMKPDTHLGENTRQIEVSDDQATSFLFS
jgi:hypothetical protein